MPGLACFHESSSPGWRERRQAGPDFFGGARPPDRAGLALGRGGRDLRGAAVKRSRLGRPVTGCFWREDTRQTTLLGSRSNARPARRGTAPEASDEVDPLRRALCRKARSIEDVNDDGSPPDTCAARVLRLRPRYRPSCSLDG